MKHFLNLSFPIRPIEYGRGATPGAVGGDLRSSRTNPAPRRRHDSRCSNVDMDEQIPSGYHLQHFNEHQLSLHAPSHDATFFLETIRDRIIRVTFTTPEHPLPPHPSVARPSGHTIAAPVDSREDLFTFNLQDGISFSVKANPTPVLSIQKHGVALYSDLANRSYTLDGTGTSRYGVFDPEALSIGLGERAAPFDLSHRTFSLSALDAAQYDAYRTDPLYKHIPLLIRASPLGSVGLFSSSHSRGVWSVGGEIDALWGRYEVMRQDFGGLELYIFVGGSIREVVQQYAEIAGYPRMIPRWALGYLASSMGYAESDDPPAQSLISCFPDLCSTHDIPCSAIHLSSGYTVSMEPPHTRNVFTLNTRRFPDLTGVCNHLAKSGIRIIANVKPYLLVTHPQYREVADAGGFFETPDGQVAMARLWSAGLGENGDGSWLDMTSVTAQKWWYAGISELLTLGVEGIWNDNNEYGLISDRLVCHRDDIAGEKNLVGKLGRLVNTEIMAKISLRAIEDAKPDRRPFLLTRCATAGTLRYANSAWSGDNYTSWDTMQGNNAMGLTAGVCLLQVSSSNSKSKIESYGHDCGGFCGPRPSPELLLRWIQIATLSPRFCIHSWKPTKEDPSSATNIVEPWMYPSVLPQIRDAIKRRYELIPYLYELTFRSCTKAQPIQRWTGWEPYDVDPQVWTNRLLRAGESQYLLGDGFVIGGVFEEGATRVRVYLPMCKETKGRYASYYNDGFMSVHPPHEYYLPGQWISINTPLSNIAVLARVGAVVPVGAPFTTTASTTLEPDLPADDWRGVEIYPPPKQFCVKGRVYRGRWREDDGVSKRSGVSEFEISYEATEADIRVCATIAKQGCELSWEREISVILPVGEEREVVVPAVGGISRADRAADSRQRRVYRVSLE
jgi:alpha-glucosidase (family GH31 glycosyl hydrolase)